MDVLVIACNPRPRSLTHVIADRVENAIKRAGHFGTSHDLYREGFDPVLREAELRQQFSFDEQVQAYVRELEKAAGLVIIHPDWWGQPPAMLKGWVDRVFRPGVAYELEGEEFMPAHPAPLLGGKRALVLCTTDLAPTREAHPIETIWRENVFRFCGIEDFRFLLLPETSTAPRGARKRWLDLVDREVSEWLVR